MQNLFQRTSPMKKHIENAVTSKEQRNIVPSAGPLFNCGLLNQERQVFLFIVFFRNISLLDGVGKRRWHSGENVRLQLRWPGFDSSSVPYVDWVSCCFSPCSQEFFFLVFFPAQKPTFPNSISTRREDLNENHLIFIKFWCSLYFRWWASWSLRQFLCFISLEIKLPPPVARLIYNLIWIRQVELKATAAVMQPAQKVQNTIFHFSWTI